MPPRPLSRQIQPKKNKSPLFAPLPRAVGGGRKGAISAHSHCKQKCDVPVHVQASRLMATQHPQPSIFARDKRTFTPPPPPPPPWNHSRIPPTPSTPPPAPPCVLSPTDLVTTDRPSNQPLGAVLQRPYCPTEASPAPVLLTPQCPPPEIRLGPNRPQ